MDGEKPTTSSIMSSGMVPVVVPLCTTHHRIPTPPSFVTKIEKPTLDRMSGRKRKTTKKDPTPAKKSALSTAAAGLYHESAARSFLRSEDLLLLTVARAGLVRTVATSAGLWLERILLEAADRNNGHVDWEHLRQVIVVWKQQSTASGHHPLLDNLVDQLAETILVDKTQRKHLAAAKEGKKNAPPAATRKAPPTADVKAARAAVASLPSAADGGAERDPDEIIEDEDDYDE